MSIKDTYKQSRKNMETLHSTLKYIEGTEAATDHDADAISTIEDADVVLSEWQKGADDSSAEVIGAVRSELGQYRDCPRGYDTSALENALSALYEELFIHTTVLYIQQKNAPEKPSDSGRGFY